jgi:F-type H+-transporting ATPase subunit alpha
MKARLSQDTELCLNRGRLLCELLKQERNEPVSLSQQVVLLYAYRKGLWDDLSLEEVKSAKKEVFVFIAQTEPGLMQEIEDKKELTPEIKEKLDRVLDRNNWK